MAQPYWVREHVRRYRESAGTDGHGWRGLDGKQQLPCLLLTTTGRRSGDARSTPLIYGQHGDRFVILASRGGSDRDPQWYGNLVAHPQVRLQVGRDWFAALARTAGPEERSVLWRLMAGIFPPSTGIRKSWYQAGGSPWWCLSNYRRRQRTPIELVPF